MSLLTLLSLLVLVAVSAWFYFEYRGIVLQRELQQHDDSAKAKRMGAGLAAMVNYVAFLKERDALMRKYILSDDMPAEDFRQGIDALRVKHKLDWTLEELMELSEYKS